MTVTGGKPQCEPTVKQSDDVRRVTWVGMAINVVLSAFKLAAGILGHSQAIVADAVHSLSDCVTDVMILVGVGFWSKPPDEEHPYGHRRIETMVTITIGLILAGVAVGLCYEALSNIRQQHSQTPGLIALIAAAVSIVVKELLYRWTVLVGQRAGSPAVIANAWHHRSDAFSSIPALVAVTAAWIFPAWTFLDHIGAVVVSLFILHAAWRITAPALAELVDAGASERVRQQIQDLAQSVDGVHEVHAIRTRFLGGGIQVDLHVLVDGELPVSVGHEIAARVKYKLLEEGPNIIDVLAHLEPFAEHPEG